MQQVDSLTDCVKDYRIFKRLLFPVTKVLTILLDTNRFTVISSITTSKYGDLIGADWANKWVAARRDEFIREFNECELSFLFFIDKGNDVEAIHAVKHYLCSIIAFSLTTEEVYFFTHSASTVRSPCFDHVWRFFPYILDSVVVVNTLVYLILIFIATTTLDKILVLIVYDTVIISSLNELLTLPPTISITSGNTLKGEHLFVSPIAELE